MAFERMTSLDATLAPQDNDKGFFITADIVKDMLHASYCFDWGFCAFCRNILCSRVSIPTVPVFVCLSTAAN